MKTEIIDGLTKMLTSGFTFVAALSWNEAAKSLFTEGGPLFVVSSYGVWAYAIFVTVIAVLIGVWIGSLKKKLVGEKDVREYNNCLLNHNRGICSPILCT